MKYTNLSLYLFTLLFVLLGCRVEYNFTGGAIPPEIKTISIPVFYNESASGPPNMSQLLTEKLKDYYQSNTKLNIVPNNGDWQLSGYISQYTVLPLAPLANETAAQSRLTIGVKVDFVNTQDDKQNFSQVFPFYRDFNQNQSLSSVEGELVNAILDQIVFDIFTKTTSNW